MSPSITAGNVTYNSQALATTLGGATSITIQEANNASIDLDVGANRDAMRTAVSRAVNGNTNVPITTTVNKLTNIAGTDANNAANSLNTTTARGDVINITIDDNLSIANITTLVVN